MTRNKQEQRGKGDNMHFRDAILMTTFLLMQQTHKEYGHLGAHAFMYNFECPFTTVELQQTMYDIVLKTCPNCPKRKQRTKKKKHGT